MSFVDLLKNDQPKAKIDQPKATLVETETRLGEEAQKPEEVLRGAGYKIKLVTPTSFGTQIDFAKSYDPEAIKKVLKDFSIKIKGKSVFIVD